MAIGAFRQSKEKFVYTGDDGTSKFVLSLDPALVTSGSGLTVYDAATDTTAITPPKRFKPRGLHWEATATGYEGKRKFLIQGTPAATDYAKKTSAAITIDGVAGATTGRRGEVLSF